MWDGWGPSGWVGWFFMTLMMLVFWGGLVALVVWAVRSFVGPKTPDRSGERPSNAIAILQERFAKGEIDQEEFERRRAVLRDQGGSEGA
jgi:putative membrane protein